MRKIITAIASTAILIFIGCAPYSEIQTGSALNPGVETLGVSVSILSPEVQSGELVLVSVVLDNHGSPPYKITFGTGCQFTWIITAADGRVIIPSHICTMATSYLKFGSDGLYERELRIRTVRDGESDWPFAEDALPVGQYKLEVYLYGYERRMNTQEVWFEVVE